MKITLKLFASLTDDLPPASKYTNLVELDIAPDTTIGQLVEQHQLHEKPPVVDVYIINWPLATVL